MGINEAGHGPTCSPGQLLAPSWRACKGATGGSAEGGWPPITTGGTGGGLLTSSSILRGRGVGRAMWLGEQRSEPPAAPPSARIMVAEISQDLGFLLLPDRAELKEPRTGLIRSPAREGAGGTQGSCGGTLPLTATGILHPPTGRFCRRGHLTPWQKRAFPG